MPQDKNQNQPPPKKNAYEFALSIYFYPVIFFRTYSCWYSEAWITSCSSRKSGGVGDGAHSRAFTLSLEPFIHLILICFCYCSLLVYRKTTGETRVMYTRVRCSSCMQQAPPGVSTVQCQVWPPNEQTNKMLTSFGILHPGYCWTFLLTSTLVKLDSNSVHKIAKIMLSCRDKQSFISGSGPQRKCSELTPRSACGSNEVTGIDRGQPMQGKLPISSPELFFFKQYIHFHFLKLLNVHTLHTKLYKNGTNKHGNITSL